MEVLRAKCEFKGIGIPSIADLEPHRADLEAGWIPHAGTPASSALCPWRPFWTRSQKSLPGSERVPQPLLAAMPIGAGDTLIRERIVGLPAGGRGQTILR